MEGASLGPAPARGLPLLGGPAGVFAHEDLNEHPRVADHHHGGHHHRHDHFERDTFGDCGGATESLAFFLTDHNQQAAQQFRTKQQEPGQGGHPDQGHAVMTRQHDGSPAVKSRDLLQLGSGLELDDQAGEERHEPQR